MSDTQRALLIIMAKQPSRGTVKTRMCPPLLPDEALAVYQAFLQDTIALVEAACGLDGHAVPALAFAPAAAEPYFRARLPAHFVLLPQQGADLGERLQQLPGQAAALGYGPAIMIDSDSPTLPPAQVAQALQALRQPDVDVALGPCDDGGYYLIGMKVPQPALFAAIPWSTAQVVAATLAAAHAAGLRVALLPAWHDVDTAADLVALQAELAEHPLSAPATRAALAHLDLTRIGAR